MSATIPVLDGCALLYVLGGPTLSAAEKDIAAVCSLRLALEDSPTRWALEAELLRQQGPAKWSPTLRLTISLCHSLADYYEVDYQTLMRGVVYWHACLWRSMDMQELLDMEPAVLTAYLRASYSRLAEIWGYSIEASLGAAPPADLPAGGD